MTYEEYKTLAKEYETTDSIKRKNELECRLLEAVVEFAENLERLHNKYGTSLLNESEASEWDFKGTYDVNDGFINPFTESEAHIVYENRWDRDSRIGIGVPMKYLDEGERKALESSLREKYMKMLAAQSKSFDEEIARVKARKDEVDKKLMKLHSEIAATEPAKGGNGTKFKVPSIAYTPVEENKPIVDMENDGLNDEAMEKVNAWLAKHFVNRPLTNALVEEIKQAMRDMGLDPSKFTAEFDEDTGELKIKPKWVEVDFIVNKIEPERKACLRGKTTKDGCEFYEDGICTGVCFPTYPPKWDKCQFDKDSNW